MKFHGVTDEQVTLNNVDVTFLADPGARLTDTTTGILLKVDGFSHVSIYDLTISGAVSSDSYSISLQNGNTATVALVRATVTGITGLGHILASGGMLTVSQSTVSGSQGGGILATGGSLVVSQSSILNNVGGGISVKNGMFAIVGNVFFNNGQNLSVVGGISIDTTANPMNRLDFNSFVLNTAQNGTGSAIHCMADLFIARNNIVRNNRNITVNTQIDGTCTYTYSLVHPGALPTGSMNFSDDPKFVNEAMGDLHLQTTSPARGKADPSADLTGIAGYDIDGVARIAPADLGAYQVKP